MAEPKHSAATHADWLHQTIEQANLAVYEWDVAGGKIAWSDNAAQVLGVSLPDIADSRRFSALMPKSRRERMQGERMKINGAATHSYLLEYEILRPGNEPLRVREAGQQLRNLNNEVTKLVGTVVPVSESEPKDYKYPEDFVEALEQMFETSRAMELPKGALILLSIENMPMIISGYGHEEAESIVADIKNVIREQLGKQDLLFRIQRDQFALLTPTIGEKRQKKLIKDLTTMLKHYGGQVKTHALHIVPNIACVDFAKCLEQDRNCSATSIIDQAYVALRSSTEKAYITGVETVCETAEESIKQMELANYLHEAIRNDRLRLAYQPIINSQTGEIAHYECLLRLVSDDGKITSAGTLIPVAERMGLIDIIDHLVLEMVVEDLLRSPNVHLAFNISSLTTMDPDWMDTLKRILEETPEIAARMTIEITETAAQHNLAETAYFVAEVQALGCMVALDDFGAGFTSFRQLKALSCDLIKIDGAFVRELEANPDNTFFVKTLLDFIKGYGLEAVAECVETGECAKILMNLGVHYMQGYYFSKPLNHRAWLSEGEYKSDVV